MAGGRGREEGEERRWMGKGEGCRWGRGGRRGGKEIDGEERRKEENIKE